MGQVNGVSELYLVPNITVCGLFGFFYLILLNE